MFDTAEEILCQCHAGEDSRAEVRDIRFGKRGVVSPNAEDFAGEFVAFANASGSAVFRGVDDSGTVHGISADRNGTTERWPVNVATNNCNPPIRPDVRNVCLPATGGDEKPILVVRVPRGAFVHQTSRGRYYARVGSTKKRLTSPELAQLFLDRGRGHSPVSPFAFVAEDS